MADLLLRFRVGRMGCVDLVALGLPLLEYLLVLRMAFGRPVGAEINSLPVERDGAPAWCPCGGSIWVGGGKDVACA